MRVLRLNVPESGSDKVILEQACVLGHVRPVQLQGGAGGEWAYSVKDTASASSDAPGTVAAFTMPELLPRHCADATIDLLKCDIESTESELFRNCGAWRQKVRFGLVELHGRYGLKDFERDIADSGVPIDVLWSDQGVDFSFVIFRTLGVGNGKQ